jgi:hypothetical protein
MTAPRLSLFRRVARGGMAGAAGLNAGARGQPLALPGVFLER